MVLKPFVVAPLKKSGLNLVYQRFHWVTWGQMSQRLYLKTGENSQLTCFRSFGWKQRFVTLPGWCLHRGHAATCMAAAATTDSEVDVSPWKK